MACCFACKYCGSKAGKARKNELSTSECLNVANQLADIGCRRVSLIGGEVFVHPDRVEIVKALTGRGVKVSIITNGFLFSEVILSELKSINIESVAVSLDGPEYIHDMFRQDGSFKRAINAINTLTENGIPVSVTSTLHSMNVVYPEELYRILKETDIFAWQPQACSPMGNVNDTLLSTDIDFGEVIRFVESHIGKSDFAIGVADNIGYYSAS